MGGGVGGAHQHEADGGVARAVGVGRQARGGGGHVHRLAAQIDGAHQRGVELALAQAAEGGAQGDEAAGLLGREGEAAAAEVELRIEAVGGDVRHGADHAGALQRGHGGLAQGRDGAGLDAGRAAPAGQAPAVAVAGDLGIGAHAHEDGGALAGQGRRAAQGLVGGGEHGGLLGQGLPEVVGREAQAAHRQADPGHRAGGPVIRRLGGPLQGRHEAVGPLDPAGAGPHGHDGDGLGAGRGRRGGRLRRGGVVGLNDDVGVVPTEAEGRDAGEQRALPGLQRVEQPEGGALQRGVRHRGVQGGRALAVAHGLHHLDEAGGPGGGDEVAQVRLERADGQIARPAKDGRAALQFGGVADGGAGGVALEQAGLGGVAPGHRPGELHGAGLALGAGGEQAAGPAVVAEAHAADHAVDGVSVAQGV